MKSFTIRVFFTTCITMVAVASASALDPIWFSQSNVNPGAAPPGGVSTITYNSLGSQTLYIWATDGTQVSPATCATRHRLACESSTDDRLFLVRSWCDRCAGVGHFAYGRIDQ